MSYSWWSSLDGGKFILGLDSFVVTVATVCVKTLSKVCWAVPEEAFFDLEELAAVAGALKQGRGVGGVCEIREIPVQFFFFNF